MNKILTAIGVAAGVSSPDEKMFRVALNDGLSTLSYADLVALVNLWADFLRRENPQCVALYADNSPQWVIVDLACQAVGIPFLPLPLFFSPLQLTHAVKSCAVDCLITDRPEHISAWFSAANAQVDFGPYRIVRREINKAAQLPEGTAKITFTSGSTGAPKGVCLSLNQQIRVADSLAEVVPSDAVRHLCLLPLSTLLENVAGVYAPLLKMGEVIIPPLAVLGFSGSALLHPQQLLHAISQHRPHSLILLPEMLLFLVGAVKQGWQPPAELEFVAVGGARVSPLILQQAHAVGLPVYEGYGLSECASVVSLNQPLAASSGTAGRPLSHARVLIENGEVVVCGNNFLGYVGEPASWYPSAVHTGDLGNLDNDGFLHLHGRKKNLLISSFGRNISPEWVESELLAGALLAQAIVIGDAQPCCAALVFPRRAEVGDNDIQALIDTVNCRLPDYARIRRWSRMSQPLAAIPGLLTENGRPRRAAIHAHFAAEIASLFVLSHPPVCSL